MQVQVIYEDDVCFVVNKPPNVLVHHSHFARNIEEPSLVELLRNQGVETPIPVHRLDRKTSGLILFVKRRELVALFQELFDEGNIQKSYLALLRGHVADSGIIDSPVKNERGNYKDALTEFSCLERLERDFNIPPYPKQRYSVVRFIPKSGRYHQLRIHANKIAHPIINDPKHGNRHHNHYFAEVLGIDQLFLHAHQLTFNHPISGEFIDLTAALPSHWHNFFSENKKGGI